MTRPVAWGSLVLASLALVACGGSGSSGTTAPPPPPVSGTVTGTAFKGPVSGGTVKAYAISNGALGAMIASVSTDAQGHFSLPMGDYAGPVMLQLTGGTYTDEATGNNMPMLSGDVMTALLPTMTAGATLSGIQMTPLTSMAQTMAQHLAGGMTDANIATATTAVNQYFMVTDILHNAPMNPNVTGSGNTASQDAVNYGMTLAAMSQLAATLQMSSSSAMVTAMMSDASDGIMDGRMAGSAVMMGGMGAGSMMPATSGASGLANAMLAFVTSNQNHSGVAAATLQGLMDQLSASDGHMMGSGSGSIVNGTISGKVFNGAMSQATVTAHAMSSGNIGAQLGSVVTDGQGNYSLSMGNYSGPVMLSMHTGLYTDLATGNTTAMGSADMMTAVLPTIGGGADVTGMMITALTSMAQARAQAMTGGMIDANINAANTAVGNYFMTPDILHTPCMDPAVVNSGGGATPEQRSCGITVAAMSQYAMTLGMPVSSGLITAMMNDASDGRMDGKMGGTAINMGGMGGMMGGGMMQSNAGTDGLATAMSEFMSSPMNHSGLTAADMNALIQKLASSDGRL